jgi:hypothetical protein
MITAGASAVLLTLLLSVYLQNHRQLRSPFTLGLVFFAAVLLLQNAGGVLFYYMMNQAGEGAGVALPMLSLNTAELVGCAALLFVTWR